MFIFLIRRPPIGILSMFINKRLIWYPTPISYQNDRNVVLKDKLQVYLSIPLRHLVPTLRDYSTVSKVRGWPKNPEISWHKGRKSGLITVWQNYSKTTPRINAICSHPAWMNSYRRTNLVIVVSDFIDRIDISSVINGYPGGGSSSYHPRMLLKVIVYAYVEKIYSGRQIA